MNEIIVIAVLSILSILVFAILIICLILEFDTQISVSVKKVKLYKPRIKVKRWMFGCEVVYCCEGYVGTTRERAYYNWLLRNLIR